MSNSKWIKSILAVLIACCATVSQSQYTATVLHPPFADESGSSHAFGSAQVGWARGPAINNQTHAVLWGSSAQSAIDLNPAGFTESRASGVTSEFQVGVGRGPATNNSYHALMWLGSASSVVDLHPPGFTSSFGQGGGGDMQVGYASALGQNRRGLLWRGTAASFVDLTPSPAIGDCLVIATDGVTQVGWYGQSQFEHALLWQGTAESVVDLHPVGYSNSLAVGVQGAVQVGAGVIGSAQHALLWRGSAGSVVDLNPAGITNSVAWGTNGTTHVGLGVLGSGLSRAVIWRDTISDVTTLHDALTQIEPTLVESSAAGINEFDEITGNGRTPLGESRAVLWKPARFPNTMAIAPGTHVSGTAEDLHHADDDRVIARPGPVFSTFQAPLVFELTSSLPKGSPARMAFEIESSASTTNLEQRLQLWNYSTETWVTIDVRPTTTVDSAFEAEAPGAPADYLQPATNQVRARISFKLLGPTFVYPWQVRVDQAVWRGMTG